MSTIAATVVEYTIRPEDAEALREGIATHLVPAARGVAGYRGFLVLDQGEGRRLALVVFDSIEQARAARGAISGAAEAHGVHALMAVRRGGATGTAIVADGIFAR